MNRHSHALRQLASTVRADWSANGGSLRMRLLLVSFRLAAATSSSGQPLRSATTPVRVAHRLFATWLLGIELSPSTRVGPALRIQHGHGLVVHERAEIGARCTLRHGVTIGVRHVGDPGAGVPRLCDDVDVGAGAQVLGAVVVGARAVVGAGAVVLTDVPAGAVAVGNPARVVRRVQTEQRWR